MSPDKFVSLLHLVTLENAARDVLHAAEFPPGRKVSQAQRDLSVWLANLEPESRLRVEALLEDMGDTVLFGLLCVLDGVRVIEHGPEKGRIEIVHVAPSGQRTLLNGDRMAFLHDVYRGQFPPP